MLPFFASKPKNACWHPRFAPNLDGLQTGDAAICLPQTQQRPPNRSPTKKTMIRPPDLANTASSAPTLSRMAKLSAWFATRKNVQPSFFRSHDASPASEDSAHAPLLAQPATLSALSGSKTEAIVGPYLDAGDGSLLEWLKVDFSGRAALVAECAAWMLSEARAPFHDEASRRLIRRAARATECAFSYAQSEIRHTAEHDILLAALVERDALAFEPWSVESRIHAMLTTLLDARLVERFLNAQWPVYALSANSSARPSVQRQGLGLVMREEMDVLRLRLFFVHNSPDATVQGHGPQKALQEAASRIFPPVSPEQALALPFQDAFGPTIANLSHAARFDKSRVDAGDALGSSAALATAANAAVPAASAYPAHRIDAPLSKPFFHEAHTTRPTARKRAAEWMDKQWAEQVARGVPGAIGAWGHWALDWHLDHKDSLISAPPGFNAALQWSPAGLAKLEHVDSRAQFLRADGRDAFAGDPNVQDFLDQIKFSWAEAAWGRDAAMAAWPTVGRGALGSAIEDALALRDTVAPAASLENDVLVVEKAQPRIAKTRL